MNLIMARADQFNGKSLIVSAEAIAVLLGVDVRTVYRWIEEGRLPKPVTLPGPKRWRRDDIERWIKCGCSVSNLKRAKAAANRS